MTTSEFIARERVWTLELRKSIHDALEIIIGKQLDHLNEMETRLAKEALTNGRVSIPLSAQPVVDDVPATPAFDQPIEAEEIAPSLKKEAEK